MLDRFELRQDIPDECKGDFDLRRCHRMCNRIQRMIGQLIDNVGDANPMPHAFAEIFVDRLEWFVAHLKSGFSTSSN